MLILRPLAAHGLLPLLPLPLPAPGRRLTWDFIPWLRTITKLPIFVKGILAPEDARIAVEVAGVDGIVVSSVAGDWQSVFLLIHAPG